MSQVLGVSVKPDQVRWEKGNPIPYEMKRGRTKVGPEDEAQLCIAALVLEEISGKEIPEGVIFYWSEKRSQRIRFTERLRQLTLETIAKVREMLEKGNTPRGKTFGGCKNCSLKFECPRD